MAGYGGDLQGIVFSCARQTYDECMAKKLFGSPPGRWRHVQAITPGMTLFLLNTSDRKLYGIFRAVGHGAMNIDPHGWTGGRGPTRFPAQVQFEHAEICEPVHESIFSRVLPREGGRGGHYSYTLDRIVVEQLCAMFRRGRVPAPMGAGQPAQQKLQAANISAAAGYPYARGSGVGYPQGGAGGALPAGGTLRVETGWTARPGQGWGAGGGQVAAPMASAMPRDSNYSDSNSRSSAAYDNPDRGAGGGGWSGPQLVSISDSSAQTSVSSSLPVYRESVGSDGTASSSPSWGEGRGGGGANGPPAGVSSSTQSGSSGSTLNSVTRAAVPQGGYVPASVVPAGSIVTPSGAKVCTTEDLARAEARMEALVEALKGMVAQMVTREEAERAQMLMREESMREVEREVKRQVAPLVAEMSSRWLQEKGLASHLSETRDLGARASAVEGQAGTA